jgi:hypothetical protein
MRQPSQEDLPFHCDLNATVTPKSGCNQAFFGERHESANPLVDGIWSMG